MRIVTLHYRLALVACAAAVTCLSMEPVSAQSGSRGSSRRVQPGSGSQAGSGAASRSSGSGTTQQGSSGEQGSSASRGSRGRTSFEGQLWSYLQQQKYKNWAPVPGQSDAQYPGESPHGAFLKMYLNRTAAGNVAELPDRSIIIKENYAADGKTLAAITVMYRSKGYNADAGDWYWVKYNPDGSVATTPPNSGSVRLSGRPQGCIECHGSAEGGDFAFFNDRL